MSKNAERLRESMRPGRVYRRQELGGISKAVDRDLRTLVDNGWVRKLGRGLYCRPQEEAQFSQRSLVRAFLKTDDFLLLSREHFEASGLKPPALLDGFVCNHKRGGEFRLGEKRFLFRVIRVYPRTPNKEYLKTILARVPGGPLTRERMPARIVAKKDPRDDLNFWLAKSPAERVAAVEFLRRQYYAMSGYKSLPRLARAVQLRARP